MDYNDFLLPVGYSLQCNSFLCNQKAFLSERRALHDLSIMIDMSSSQASQSWLSILRGCGCDVVVGDGCIEDPTERHSYKYLLSDKLLCDGGKSGENGGGSGNSGDDGGNKLDDECGVGERSNGGCDGSGGDVVLKVASANGGGCKNDGGNDNGGNDDGGGGNDSCGGGNDNGVGDDNAVVMVTPEWVVQCIVNNKIVKPLR